MRVSGMGNGAGMETQWETTHLRVRGRWGQSQHSRADGAENQTSHQQQMACGQLECGKCGSPFPGTHWAPGVPATSMAKPRGLGGLYHLIFTSKSHKKILVT